MPNLRCPECFYATSVRADAVETARCKTCDVDLHQHYFEGRSAVEAKAFIAEENQRLKSAKSQKERKIKGDIDRRKTKGQGDHLSKPANVAKWIWFAANLAAVIYLYGFLRDPWHGYGSIILEYPVALIALSAFAGGMKPEQDKKSKELKEGLDGFYIIGLYFPVLFLNYSLIYFDIGFWWNIAGGILAFLFGAVAASYMRSSYEDALPAAVLQEINDIREEEEKQKAVERNIEASKNLSLNNRINRDWALANHEKKCFCPWCGFNSFQTEKRGKTSESWRHSTKDGSRDYRYKSNYSTYQVVNTLLCNHCGARSKIWFQEGGAKDAYLFGELGAGIDCIQLLERGKFEWNISDRMKVKNKKKGIDTNDIETLNTDNLKIKFWS